MTPVLQRSTGAKVRQVLITTVPDRQQRVQAERTKTNVGCPFDNPVSLLQHPNSPRRPCPQDSHEFEHPTPDDISTPEIATSQNQLYAIAGSVSFGTGREI